MFRFTGKIQYVGHEEVHEFTTGNAALALWEQYAVRKHLPTGKDSPPTLSSLYIAWVALGIEQGFEAWIETVDGIECDGSDPDKPDAEVPPTTPAPSPA